MSIDISQLVFLARGNWPQEEKPSGIVRSRVKVGGKAKIVIYPQFLRQSEFRLQTRRQFQPGGISLSSKVGDSNEFASTREFRDGDRLRDVHWASSARTGKLIVKEYIEEYFVRVGLFVDTELKRFYQIHQTTYDNQYIFPEDHSCHIQF